MAARQRHLVKKQATPPSYDASAYLVEAIEARSRTTARACRSRSCAAATRRSTGPRRSMIHGYGAYGHSLDASFGPNRFSLVDRGFVFALAHVRGGTEKGFGWYEDGKLANKPNTFSDFIAATQALVARGYGDAEARRRAGRQRRRAADGGDRQYGAGALRGDRRRRAVRRHAQHHARRQPAADAAGMARMGRPVARPRRLRRRSAATAPTRTCGRSATPRYSRSAASPIRA